MSTRTFYQAICCHTRILYYTGTENALGRCNNNYHMNLVDVKKKKEKNKSRIKYQ